ncbi:hypothetical protein JW824_10520 [bacterium]|nr:hypothetical protein [bacterium]
MDQNHQYLSQHEQNHVFRLHRFFTFSILFFIFFLAYILTPYWQHSSSLAGTVLLLMITIGLNLLWSTWASNHFQFRIGKNDGLIFLILFFIVGLLNFRALTAVIPWRGDEDYHITITLQIVYLWRLKWIIFFVCLSFFLGFSAWYKSKWLLIISMTFMILYAIFFNHYHDINYITILRYPYFQSWFNALIPTFYKYIHAPEREIVFRIVPFISVVTLVWICYKNLNLKNPVVKLIWSVAFCSMPILIYYTSILYLEMPAVLLMTLVCLHIRELLYDDMQTISTHPYWYALIFIGFLKETTIPFLVSFVICRLIIRFRHPRKKRYDPNDVFNEGKVIFVVLFPFLYYIFFRNQSIDMRGFSPQISNLMNLSIYPVLLRSFFEQFGGFFLLFIVGGLLLWQKRETASFLFYIVLLILVPSFHILDNIDYTGYSRFNLFLVPLIIMASTVLINKMINKKRILSLMIALAFIGLHYRLSPLNGDGTKKPYWGNYLIDTSEHYYPYRKTLLWLKENHHNDEILFTGMYYPYYLGFYFRQLEWYPTRSIQLVDQNRNENKEFIENLLESTKPNCHVVVYHTRNHHLFEYDHLNGFSIEKVFTNQSQNYLIVYGRQ